MATEFRGRGHEIHLYPLSFAEYYNALGGNQRTRLREYFRYGGIPQLFSYNDDKEKEDFLRSLFTTVYLRDIIERHRIKHEEEFAELIEVIASSIGTPCNPHKLANTFMSVKQVKIDVKTIRSQLEVDFVVNRGDERYYIQSVYDMPDREKKDQETASLRKIDDSFKKFIVVYDDILPYIDDYGYHIVGLFDFLITPTGLETY